MTNPFQSIPPTVRKWIYLILAIVGLGLGGLQVYGIESIGAFDVSKGLEVLGYLTIGLGFTAASNLPSYEDVVEGDAPAPERGELGQTSVVTVLLVVLLVIVILALLGFLR